MSKFKEISLITKKTRTNKNISLCEVVTLIATIWRSETISQQVSGEPYIIDEDTLQLFVFLFQILLDPISSPFEVIQSRPCASGTRPSQDRKTDTTELRSFVNAIRFLRVKDC